MPNFSAKEFKKKNFVNKKISKISILLHDFNRLIKFIQFIQFIQYYPINLQITNHLCKMFTIFMQYITILELFH